MPSVGSAGIGRTGSFIITDAIVDALRKEKRKSASRLPSSFNKSVDSARSHEQHAHASNASLGGLAGESSDASKSVSFLNPFPSQSTELLSTVFSTSPSHLSASPAAAEPSRDTSDPVTYLEISDDTKKDKMEDEMELDLSAGRNEGDLDIIGRGLVSDERFSKHRGSIAATVSSEDVWSRRTSLADIYHGSERSSPEG